MALKYKYVKVILPVSANICIKKTRNCHK